MRSSVVEMIDLQNSRYRIRSATINCGAIESENSDLRSPMPTLISNPTVIAAAGNKPKRIEEYAGRVNSGHEAVSVARMVSPEGWREPGQRPAFEEITVVLRGMLRVEHEQGSLDVQAGQAVVAHPGEWIRYSSPEPGGAEYVAICVPAFSPATVNREEE
jgi:mannose-6-phosphate isomerase-like protein (cupin superfamily)